MQIQSFCQNLEKMSVRVGRCLYRSGRRIDPEWDGYEPVVVLTKSSKYGELGPYVLTNEEGHIFENIWQFAKLYEYVPKSKQPKDQYDSTIVWSYPRQQHVKNGKILDAYWEWRQKGLNCKYPIRYPVGKEHRHRCLGALYPDQGGKMKLLDYIESRKKIYLSEYCRLVRKQPLYKKLKRKLKEGKRLMILEVDAPHQESLNYYQEKYGVGNNFIVDHSMKANLKNLKIMLNDDLHPFGHGYCLAAALLGLVDELVDH